MDQKNRIQKELDDLKQQGEALKKRRAFLQEELSKTTTSIESQKQELGEMMLEGKDATQETDALARAKGKAEGLLEAIRQSEKNMEAIDLQINKKARELYMVDYERLIAETDLLLLSGMDELKQAFHSLNSIDHQVDEINKLGPSMLDAAQLDHFTRLQRAFQYLLSQGTPGNIPYKLQEVERNFPDVLAKARSQKSQ